jgi:multidrug resistance efflux pump
MRRVLTTLGLAALAATAAADDAPETATAKKRDVEFHVDLVGAIDAKDAVEVAFRPQVWGEELEVEDAAAPGAVESGATLVRFKSEKIDVALRAAERDLAVAKAQVAAQTEDQKRTEATTAAAVARAEFEAATAQARLEQFEKIDAPLRIEESDHSLQGTRNWIADQTEELKQLEKMYKADDLTEETEEIVLTRARRDLERAKRSLDFQTRRDKTMREVDLPRERESLSLDARRAAAERDKAVAVTALQSSAARVEVARSAANVERQEADLGKLNADRALFELKSPAAGFAAPGAMYRGKWVNADDVRKSLKKGGKFRPNDVVFTVVTGRGWRVATSAPETALSWIRPGQDAEIVATQTGPAPWTAKVVQATPYASGAEYAVDLEPTQPSEGLIGMTCKVRIKTGSRAAILVPKTAVEDGGFDKWLHVVGADAKAARRVVTLGQPHDDEIEVLSGLAEGEKVLATAPKK